MSFTGAYLKAGYTLENPRNQWSAVRDDGRVALTIWSDEIDKSAEPWRYDVSECHPRFSLMIGKVGHAVRAMHIERALGCGQTDFDLILCVAEDTTANPRKVKIARHWDQRVGRLVDGSFDRQAGTFVMELCPA